MTTTTHTVHQPDSTGNPAAGVGGVRRGPIARVVAASIATGLFGALGGTVFAAGGGSEHVITGSAMLAFAFGWAMLAVLSARLTSQPQRWARVPAALMAVTGLGLLAFAPDDAALTTAGWVWPPVVLVLAVWMFVQLRRTLQGRSRWMLYPVIGFLAASAVGGTVQSVALAQDHRSNVMPGKAYDVGGYRLHLNCTGTGSPTVVLESGLGETSPNWSHVTQAVGRSTRVCAYDRAGQGWSDDAPHPQDSHEVAADLHTLLAKSQESGPFVMAGHSTGGVYAMTYAAQYPDDVVGMVLLDSATPYQFTALPDYAGTYPMQERGQALVPSILRLGVGRAVPTSMLSGGLPSPAAEQVRAFTASSRGWRNVRDEFSVYRRAFEQAQALTTLGDRPLVVVTATANLKTPGWVAAQDQLAALSSNSSHRTADSTHAGLLEDPDDAATSVRAIADVVASVRDRSLVSAG